MGFSLSYGISRNEYYDYKDNKYRTYEAGMFLRKYKLLAKDFYLFGEGDLMYYHASYNYSQHTSYEANYDSKKNSVSLNFTPGIAYNLTRSIQMETGLQNLLYISYSSGNENAKDPGYSDYKENSFSAGTSLSTISLNSIFVGIRFWLNK